MSFQAAIRGSSLAYGQAVTVLFRSNITKTYAVESPGTGTREELELWRVELHKNKKSAEARSEEFADLSSMFGIVLRDGLLLRNEATNTAEQVYRFRLDEQTKLIRKTEGALVQTGGERLPGDWYLALAADGTRGYVYSNQLILWDADKEERPSALPNSLAAHAQEGDLFEKTWRPDYFRSMVDQGRVDLASFQQRFGIFTDPLVRQIRIERPEFSKFYLYDSIERRQDGAFLVKPTGLVFSFTQTGDLVITPPVEDLRPEDRKQAEESGTVKSFVFMQQREDPRTVIAAEERRRLAVLSALLSDGELFETDSGASLSISRTGRFTWAGYDALVPAYIPEGSGESGTLSVDLFLGPEINAIWHGGFSLRFDAAPRKAISFAYRVSAYALELAFIPPELIRNGVVTAPEGLDTVVSFTRYR